MGILNLSGQKMMNPITNIYMTDFIQAIFITSLFIFGLNCLFSEGYLFHKAGEWMAENMHEWLYKPLIGCSVCMASIWGSLVYLSVFVYEFGLWLWPVFCICLCGFNYMILRLYQSIQSIGE